MNLILRKILSFDHPCGRLSLRHEQFKPLGFIFYKLFCGGPRFPTGFLTDLLLILHRVLLTFRWCSRCLVI